MVHWSRQGAPPARHIPHQRTNAKVHDLRVTRARERRAAQKKQPRTDGEGEVPKEPSGRAAKDRRHAARSVSSLQCLFMRQQRHRKRLCANDPTLPLESRFSVGDFAGGQGGWVGRPMFAQQAKLFRSVVIYCSARLQRRSSNHRCNRCDSARIPSST